MTRPRTFVLPGLLMIGLVAPALARNASSTPCQNLWITRNEVFKLAGYCFKTSEAIRVFGNAGCQYDDINDVPLSASDRNVVKEAANLEAYLGCRRR